MINFIQESKQYSAEHLKLIEKVKSGYEIFLVTV